MDDAYSTQLTAGESVEATGLEQLMALKEGDTFLVADGWGDMKGGADGLFAGDTRVLSRWAMTVGLLKPSRLSSGVSQDNVFFSCHTTNRPLPPMGGRSAPAGVRSGASPGASSGEGWACRACWTCCVVMTCRQASSCLRCAPSLIRTRRAG